MYHTFITLVWKQRIHFQFNDLQHYIDSLLLFVMNSIYIDTLILANHQCYKNFYKRFIASRCFFLSLLRRSNWIMTYCDELFTEQWENMIVCRIAIYKQRDLLSSMTRFWLISTSFRDELPSGRTHWDWPTRSCRDFRHPPASSTYQVAKRTSPSGHVHL